MQLDCDIGQLRHSSRCHVVTTRQDIDFEINSQANPSCSCSIGYVTFQDVVCTLIVQVCFSRRVFRAIFFERSMAEIRLSVDRQ